MASDRVRFVRPSAHFRATIEDIRHVKNQFDGLFHFQNSVGFFPTQGRLAGPVVSELVRCPGRH